MRTHDGYDARDSYKRAEDAMGENVRNGNDDIDSNGMRFQGTPSEVAATMRILVKSQEEQHQLNDAILQSLTNLHKKIDSGRGTSRLEGSKSTTRRRRRNSSGSSDSKESSRIQAFLLVKEKERGTIEIALGMNLRRLNLVPLMVR